MREEAGKTGQGEVGEAVDREVGEAVEDEVAGLYKITLLRFQSWYRFTRVGRVRLFSLRVYLAAKCIDRVESQVWPRD
ncbi:MAG: hypothetical protein R3282_01160 [Rhodothermales bacterium]|nr:hypothetical protein [Rhodothermales bacterium]